MNGLHEPLVSVIVPTRNRAPLLPGLLAALRAQKYPRFETIVVDDASEDETERILRTWEGQGRIALRLQNSGGSYAARNAGWHAASGEILAFTDDDCLPEPGWLSALVAAMTGPRVAGAQGVTLARPGEITPFTHQIEQTAPGAPYRTCNIAYRRSVMEQLGGFDSSLRWYADNILGLHALAYGPIAFAPDAIVLHPPRPREWRDRSVWLARFAADTVHRKHLQQFGLEPPIPTRALPIVLWVLRPLWKQSAAHLRYALRRPRPYLREIRPMLWERREMMVALWTYWRAGSQGGEHAPLELPPLPAVPLVSVVIVTGNRRALLEDAVTAVERQTWPRHETVIVQNGPYGWTQGFAEERGLRWAGVTCGGRLGAARDAGVEASRGDIVAFTDDDCLPDERWLEAAVEAFRSRPHLHGVQGRTLAERGPVGAHAVRVPGPDPLYQTCNIAYRRAAIDAAGGVDSRFRGWFEDTALGARVLHNGPIGFCAEMIVTHRAMPRVPFDRARWGGVLRDERRLALLYPDFYRATRGPTFFLAVIGHWLLGSPVKTMARELPRAQGDPRGFLRLVWTLLGERWALVLALGDMLRNRRRIDETILQPRS